MKKLIIITALLLTALSAQSQIGSASTNVNVTINEILSINVFNNNVNININNAEDVINGKTKQMLSHVQITSTVPYEVRVSASSNFIGQTSAEEIDIQHLKLNVTAGAGVNFSPQTDVTAIITTDLESGALLGSSTSGDVNRILDISYFMEGGEHLLVSPDTYSNIITYSIIPN